MKESSGLYPEAKGRYENNKNYQNKCHEVAIWLDPSAQCMRKLERGRGNSGWEGAREEELHPEEK